MPFLPVKFVSFLTLFLLGVFIAVGMDDFLEGRLTHFLFLADGMDNLLEIRFLGS